MIKLFIKVSFTVCFLFIGASQATILPLNGDDLTTDDYIVYNKDGVNYDIAWASQVSSEVWFVDNDYNYNLLFAADYHVGWSFAGENGIPTIEEIFLGITGAELLAEFTRNGEFVHAFEYWNSFFDTPENGLNLGNKEVASAWGWSIPSGTDIDALSFSEKQNLDFEINDLDTGYDTFYIRSSQVQGNGPTPVPEPTTILIFALGLIALVCKNKLFS
jgi:hypothetical protein